MSSDSPKGIIELGNLNLKCIIFRIEDEDTPQILSTSIISSEGVHNGVIVNLKNATRAIRSCISSAEKKANVSIKKINVVISNVQIITGLNSFKILILSFFSQDKIGPIPIIIIAGSTIGITVEL